MSQEIREKALDAAVRVEGANGKDAVIAAAAAFESYIANGGSKSPGPKAPAATSASAATSKSSAPAQTASKPANTKPASGSATTGSKPKKAASEPEIDPEAKKMVGDKVNELLKADKREEAIALLASFDGAQSATGIVKQGQEVIDAFMAQADEILGAAEGLAD